MDEILCMGLGRQSLAGARGTQVEECDDLCFAHAQARSEDDGCIRYREWCGIGDSEGERCVLLGAVVLGPDDQARGEVVGVRSGKFEGREQGMVELV